MQKNCTILYSNLYSGCSWDDLFVVLKTTSNPRKPAKIKESKRACRGRQALLEKVFCYLWGVAKNYIMYWGVTNIIILKRFKKCSQKIKFFKIFFVNYHYLLCKYHNLLYKTYYKTHFGCAFCTKK